MFGLQGLVELPTQIFDIVQRRWLWFSSFDCLGCLRCQKILYPQRNGLWFYSFDCFDCLSCCKRLVPQRNELWFCSFRLFRLPVLSSQLKFLISSREMWCGFVASDCLGCLSCQKKLCRQRKGLWFCSFDCFDCLSC